MHITSPNGKQIALVPFLSSKQVSDVGKHEKTALKKCIDAKCIEDALGRIDTLAAAPSHRRLPPTRSALLVGHLCGACGGLGASAGQCGEREGARRCSLPHPPAPLPRRLGGVGACVRGDVRRGSFPFRYATAVMELCPCQQGVGRTFAGDGKRGRRPATAGPWAHASPPLHRRTAPPLWVDGFLQGMVDSAAGWTGRGKSNREVEGGRY